jgi:DNA-binding winged helix-turn-helix (wHTH) protein
MDVVFGDFKLDSAGRRLLRKDEYVHLSRKAFDLLELLAVSRPRAVSKAELQERLWPSTFVVEANLANLVAEIRAALGDDARKPRFIRTVHGIGYAFSGTPAELPSPQPSRDSLCWIVQGERRIQLSEGEHLVGRHPASILPIDSPTVSRHHASICVTGDLAVLKDLGSLNGTRIRDSKIDAPTTLADGDEIRVGSVVFVFRVASLAPATRPSGSTGETEP